MSIASAVGFLILTWHFYRFDPAWSKGYVGMKQVDVERLLGKADAGDFDGLYWCNGFWLYGRKLSTKALFLALDSDLSVIQQEIIMFPDALICVL